MNRDTLKKLFPNASTSFLRLHGLIDPPIRDTAFEHKADAPWSGDDLAILTEYYRATPVENFELCKLSERLGRTKVAIALKASRLGLSMPRGKRGKSTAARKSMSEERKARFLENPEQIRKLTAAAMAKPNGFLGKTHSQELRARMSLIAKNNIAKNGHPRGMLGKHHTQETKDAISKFHSGKPMPREAVEKMIKTKIERGNLCRKRTECSWKAGWVEVGGIRFFSRSRWEANYGRYLQWQKEQKLVSAWEHEPETFWFTGIKRGCVSYLPDFKVTNPNGSVEFHEVKGWMDARSITKIKRMAKYHPSVALKVIDGPRYRALAKSVSQIVPGWQK